MGSTERIRNVARRVAKWSRAGHQMVVVPSAMSGETNRLLALAKELAPVRPSDDYSRELDMLEEMDLHTDTTEGLEPPEPAPAPAAPEPDDTDDEQPARILSFKRDYE